MIFLALNDTGYNPQVIFVLLKQKSLFQNGLYNQYDGKGTYRRLFDQ